MDDEDLWLDEDDAANNYRGGEYEKAVEQQRVRGSLWKSLENNPVRFAQLVRSGGGSDIADMAWAKWGDTCLTSQEWKRLFRHRGYHHDEDRVPRPRDPLVLWRGAAPEHRDGWSWTSTRDAALVYASGFVVQSVGLIWRAVVEPSRLLAAISNKKYTEYVVDTDGLHIEPHGLWCRCPQDLIEFAGTKLQAQTALDLHELVHCPRI